MIVKAQTGKKYSQYTFDKNLYQEYIKNFHQEQKCRQYSLKISKRFIKKKNLQKTQSWPMRHEKVFHIISHQESQIKPTYHLAPTRMAYKTNCWQGYGATGTQISIYW